MKTAEEWLKEKWFDFLELVEPQEVIIRGDTELEDFIKQIQLDAMKEGARRAAKMARNHLHGTASGWVNLTKRGETVNNVILTAAEQWTVSDL